MVHLTWLQVLSRAVKHDPVDQVRSLLDRTPEEVIEQYVMPLLQNAVRDGSSVDTIRLLLENAPQERLRGDNLYDLIAQGLGYYANADVLRLLLEQDPSIATYENDHRQCYLLHTVCDNRGPHEFIEYVLGLNPDAISMIDWDSGDTPLHFASRMPWATVRLLFDAYPGAINSSNMHGQVPLHYACTSQAPLEVVRFLVTSEPDSVQLADDEGMLPLHYAVHDAEIVDFLIEQYPDGVTARTDLGMLPLHEACSRACWDAVRSLLEAYPNGVRVADSLGYLPIHMACTSSVPLDLLMLLFQNHPTCAQHLDASGRLPFHHACGGHASIEVVHLILQFHKEAVQVADPKGWLPLHVACPSSSQASKLETVALLVRENPLTLLMKTNDGRTPLRMAYSNRHADNSVRTYLLGEQERIVQSHIDAIKSTACGMAGFDDLVANKIWNFMEDLWHPSENDAK